jgi:hypothetical protein
MSTKYKMQMEPKDIAGDVKVSTQNGLGLIIVTIELNSFSLEA